ncbi:pyridine nucleotide-disulfide oxidoreductase/dicluster-binding protein [uncultured Pseudodesulfovibrio sp.]|uniref:pyridine nucleotide-disulfide oxidoreductase/dicluster-binding protein n=1 Tax=uncultured Pseudodesulfovibrio sp. TaxID=2035858 RepID=UPI0029C6F2A0|nr:pyridine nucleotide-disulfide oxidoreductase/dicluster-binding protein [uncultured Pseudodesulfovibrio sp.]
MEQAELRQWENKCIQEESPKCMAACPLHVDARECCSLLAAKRVDKAWAVLAKTMPLPGVLARACDAPCKAACLRGEKGGPIEMGALERFLADAAQPAKPPRPLPRNGKSVAVIGGSMTGLCAAWEIARKGFAVTVFCEVPNVGCDLPEGVLDSEIEAMDRMGVSIRSGVTLSQELVEGQLEECDAVFVDSDGVPEAVRYFGEPDEMTLGTNRLGLFASRVGEPSPVFQAAAGRRAANSIMRFSQGVSMVKSRELEGPYETRLFTNLSKVEPVAPVNVGGGYDEASAVQEAARCLKCDCMECVKGCVYLKHFKQYPKVYVRQVYNNEAIVKGTRQANKMINSCMLCGLCETVCPEDFSMADVCLEARRGMVDKGTMPPSAHEFALRDMAFADGDKCALARHAPGENSSEYVFFPGCQLTATDPGGAERAYADLRERLGKVGLILRCCGAPAAWSGRKALFQESLAELKTAWQGLGSPRIIAACPSCIKILREAMPEAEIVSHWSILSALGLPESALKTGGTLAVNDPCAAREDGALRGDVRTLLDSMGVSMVEPEYTGELTQCCGYGGLLNEVNPDLGQAAARARADAVDEDYVTYCAMCREMIARTGKTAMHLYDLVYPGAEKPGARPTPGHSERRENRVHLREKLLRELWSESGDVAAEDFEKVLMDCTEAGAAAMEERRILTSDVQKVLLQAERSGKHLVHGETGHLLASFRPAVVTYWVEYERTDGGYLVHNAWCHRMKIKGGQP